MFLITMRFEVQRTGHSSNFQFGAVKIETKEWTDIEEHT